MSTEGMGDKSGLSRRDLIKRGAAAGAVFWAVPVIESVTSRAAAQSGCVTFNASWVYVVYTYTVGTVTTTYYTGFSLNDTTNQCTAASYPDNPGNIPYQVGPCSNGMYYEIWPTKSTPARVTYGTSSPPALPATFVGYPACNTYVTLNGGEVTPVLAGVNIVAAFCFGANKISGGCVGGDSTCANCG